MEVYGSAETFWLLLKDHLLGSAEYVTLIENYDINFHADNLLNDSTTSFDQPKQDTLRNNSASVRPDFDSKELLRKESMRKSMNQGHIRESNVQVSLKLLDPEVSFEDNSFGCIRIEFNKKRNKKWKTLVSKRLKDVMDTRISLSPDQAQDTSDKFAQNVLQRFPDPKKKYDSKQVEFWRSVSDLKTLSQHLQGLCQKNLLSKFFFLGKSKTLRSVSEFEAKNASLKQRAQKGSHLVWRRNFLQNQIQRSEMGLSRNFYNALKVLVFTNFPEKVSRIIQNDLARVKKYGRVNPEALRPPEPGRADSSGRRRRLGRNLQRNRDDAEGLPDLPRRHRLRAGHEPAGLRHPPGLPRRVPDLRVLRAHDSEEVSPVRVLLVQCGRRASLLVDRCALRGASFEVQEPDHALFFGEHDGHLHVLGVLHSLRRLLRGGRRLRDSGPFHVPGPLRSRLPEHRHSRFVRQNKPREFEFGGHEGVHQNQGTPRSLDRGQKHQFEDTGHHQVLGDRVQLQTGAFVQGRVR